MSEDDWSACTDPEAMFAFLREKELLSERKGRLFACAAVRRLWHLLTDERSRKAVEFSERFADGGLRAAVLKHARAKAEAAEQVRRKLASQMDPGGEDYTAWWRALAAADAARVALLAAMDTAVLSSRGIDLPDMVALLAAAARQPEHRGDKSAAAAEKGVQCALLHDLFGPLPFRPLGPLAPSVRTWNDCLVVKLAAAAYEERDLPAGTLAANRLGVLADALLDAGCTDAELLRHLREPGPHRRGCWAVDLLLEKT